MGLAQSKQQMKWVWYSQHAWRLLTSSWHRRLRIYITQVCFFICMCVTCPEKGGRLPDHATWLGLSCLVIWARFWLEEPDGWMSFTPGTWITEELFAKTNQPGKKDEWNMKLCQVSRSHKGSSGCNLLSFTCTITHYRHIPEAFARVSLLEGGALWVELLSSSCRGGNHHLLISRYTHTHAHTHKKKNTQPSQQYRQWGRRAGNENK